MAGERTRERGELEAAVLGVLWEQADERGAMTAKEILDLVPGRPPAHTTLLTALDRLTRKGEVRRVGDARRGMRFAPVHSEAEHAGTAMRGVLDETHDRGAALLNFAGSLGADDIAVLEAALSGRGRKAKRGARAT